MNEKMISSLNLSTTEKILLYVLKERGADSPEGLTVTIERVGDYAGLHRNTTSRTLKALADDGFIELQLGKGKASSTIRMTL